MIRRLSIPKEQAELGVGGLIGVILSVLYAPKGGNETRADIRKFMEELLEKAKEPW